MLSLTTHFQSYCKNHPEFLEEKRNEQAGEAFWKKIQSSLLIEGSSEFVTEIQREIKYLSGWKAGRKLFEDTLKEDTQIKILQAPENQHSSQDGTLEIKPYDSKIHKYYCAANEKGEVILVRYPDPSIILAHETLHKHDRENRRFQHLAKRTDELFNPSLSNMEEQVVITGFYSSIQPYKYKPLNESLFLKLSGCPMRVNHLGLQVIESESPSMTDCASMNALGTIKRFESLDVNTPQKTHDCPYLQLRGKQVLPLTAACASNSQDVIAYLFSKGAKVDAKDDVGGPIHGATLYGQKTVISDLLAKGANINAPNQNGSTPLMVSIEQERVSAFRFLLSKKADLKLKNDKGETALAIAIRLQLPTYVKELVDAGAYEMAF